MIQIPTTRDTGLERGSVITGMQEAWLDHRHCRDQTWHSVTATLALAVGFVTLSVKLPDPLTTALAGGFVLVAAFSGMLITQHHREYEVRKFTHIMQCEYWLRLRELEWRPGEKDYISVGGLLHWERRPEKPPGDILFCQMLNPRAPSTPLFIMRVHAAIYVLACLYFRQAVPGWGNWIAFCAGVFALVWILAVDVGALVEARSRLNHSPGATSGPTPGAASSAPQG